MIRLFLARVEFKSRYFREQYLRYRQNNKNHQPALLNRCLTMLLEWNLTVMFPTTCCNKSRFVDEIYTSTLYKIMKQG